MGSNFFKFPSTPHLAVLGKNDVRDDKVFSEKECLDFLKNELIIEEKIDGANLGISFDTDGNIMAQNRGSLLLLPGSGQWKKLSEWLEPKLDALFENLGEHYILFGEWCYAQHSVPYDKLPDWFSGFDVFDKQAQKFLSCERREQIFQHCHIFSVPKVARGKFTLDELKNLMQKSAFGSQTAEGLYLRHDSENWLIQRAKLVRENFVQEDTKHWSLKTIETNRKEKKT
jgi:ATP-dependent RNA circularization protein (DNA/RNA ligase family)